MDVSSAGDDRRQCLVVVAPEIRAGNAVRWPYLSVPTAPIDERYYIAAVAVPRLV